MRGKNASKRDRLNTYLKTLASELEDLVLGVPTRIEGSEKSPHSTTKRYELPELDASKLSLRGMLMILMSKIDEAASSIGEGSISDLSLEFDAGHNNISAALIVSRLENTAERLARQRAEEKAAEERLSDEEKNELEQLRRLAKKYPKELRKMEAA